MTFPTPMSLERALVINKALCQRYFLSNGLTNSPVLPDLTGVSLRDMLTATELVRHHNATAEPIDGKIRGYTVPDDRLVAAIYVGLHYEADDEPVTLEPVEEDGQWQIKAVAVVDVTTRVVLRDKAVPA
ncbi:hypothetical protein [Ciceribacter sp. L1K22]|uniref:hypothetical protein n=1 Tax=Ciceribacter sp. L1K22 TaxID=2820275 RepID=UPI001ABE0A4E|nr:hypothetical protein [Ciceribacter sp. L1K22]MBO3760388.1 hypothetical protein [Ciceribacter sp. L1K22]